MTAFPALLRIAASQIVGHWENFSRKAYVEPLVIQDGYHRYVLMSEDDYKALLAAQAKTAETAD